MAVLDAQPDTTNFLSPVGFRFSLKRAPTLTYFTKGVSLPGINLGEIPLQNPFVKIPQPGDKLAFDPITLRSGVDENLKNYQEIYDWMVGLGFPESYAQSKHPQIDRQDFTDKADIVSDGTLTVLTSGMNPSVEFTFKDMFPTMLSPLPFGSDFSEIEYMECDVTFLYTSFEMNIL